MTPKPSVETITPEKAASLLHSNPRNRSLKQSVVERYARDMENGNWTLNGEPILINGDGSLLNGQHRLHACVHAGVPFQTLVVTGISDQAMPTIDTGKSRTLGDYLGIADLPNATIVASMVGWAMRYDGMVRKGTRQLAPQGRWTRSEQLAFVDSYKDTLLHSADVIFDAKSQLNVVGYPSVFGFVHFLASRDTNKPQSKIDKFVASVIDPAGLGSHEAPLMLRARLLDSWGPRQKPSGVYIAALTVKAMRAWLEDKEIGVLKWTARRSEVRGRKPDAFPRLTTADEILSDVADELN